MKLKKRKSVPFEFVLESLESLVPMTRPMFGCTAVYIEDKIVLVLREKEQETQDNGIWLATTQEHHASLRRDFPSMRSIQVFGTSVTNWQVLPADRSDFEESAMKACELIKAGDIRIGKVPKPRKKRKGKPKILISD